ncbi:MAG: linear amide C-N hydrolase [Methyloceanibacter sp.]|uniref:linear amide C-N hydrolase n=1 Tax=Methyloceanibacter sp. TaxID=1965321 RepID=UPI003EE0CBE0
MIRRASTCALVAAFACATTPSLACTNIALKAEDGSAIRARTMEFAQALDSNVLLVPAGTSMRGTLPDGGEGIGYTTKYNMLGANAVGANIIVDGMNDQGVSIGLLYFPGFAEYAKATPQNADRAMAPHEFGNWVLGNFASVDEVKVAIANVAVVATPAPAPLNTVQPLHYIVSDKSGKSIVIEPVGGTLKVYDNPLGVMTNSPGFDWHLTNLRNYVNLSVNSVKPVDLDGTEFSQLGQGAGMHGLPGDFTPPSRFVRATAFSQAAEPQKTARDMVLAGFHIMNQFDIPYGTIREDSGKETTVEYTQWTTVSDMKNLRFYFKTYGNQSIHMIDLAKAFAAAKGEIRQIKMGTDPLIADESTEFMSANHAAE